MANRKPFKLRKALLFWNIGLAVYSVMSSFRALDEFLYVYRNFGFHYTVCDGSVFQKSPHIAFWLWMFAISKLIEFGDTAFIVLRKQNLIFLHWYHHMATFIYVWFVIPYEFSPSRW